MQGKANRVPHNRKASICSKLSVSWVSIGQFCFVSIPVVRFVVALYYFFAALVLLDACFTTKKNLGTEDPWLHTM